MDFKDSLVSREQVAEQVCQVTLGHLDPQGLPVIEERQVLLGMLALQALTDSLGLKDHKVIKDFLDHKDLQGSRAQLVLLDQSDLKETLGSREILAEQVSLAVKVFQGTEALLDCRVLKDQLEQLASLGFLVLLDNQVRGRISVSKLKQNVLLQYFESLSLNKSDFLAVKRIVSYSILFNLSRFFYISIRQG